jgi:hypothetical protein
MDSQGNLRRLDPKEKPRLDEVLILEERLVAVEAMSRQQRRALYREMSKNDPSIPKEWQR